MTTEIAQELVDFTVIKAVVDISGQGLGKLALAQAIKSIDGQAPADIKVPYDIDLYNSTESAKAGSKPIPTAFRDLPRLRQPWVAHLTRPAGRTFSVCPAGPRHDGASTPKQASS